MCLFALSSQSKGICHKGARFWSYLHQSSHRDFARGPYNRDPRTKDFFCISNFTYIFHVRFFFFITNVICSSKHLTSAIHLWSSLYANIPFCSGRNLNLKKKTQPQTNPNTIHTLLYRQNNQLSLMQHTTLGTHTGITSINNILPY